MFYLFSTYQYISPGSNLQKGHRNHFRLFSVITEKVRMGVAWVSLSMATFEVLVLQIQINTLNYLCNAAEYNDRLIYIEHKKGTFSIFCVVAGLLRGF